MSTITLIGQIALILGFPWLSRKLSRWSGVEKVLSPIVLCYLVGILLRNVTSYPIDDEVATRFSELSILFAIPLLLFGTRLDTLRRFAGPSLISFGWCVLAGLLSSALAAWVFRNAFTEGWALAGMLTGIYTGGTPNMQAIGLALQVDQEYIILLNGADIVLGGSYLLLLFSVLPRLLGKVLPPFRAKEDRSDTGDDMKITEPFVWSGQFKAIGLTVLIITATVGLTLLFFGNLNQTAFVMLCLTVLSLAASFIPAVRTWGDTFVSGEYFLLIFSVSLGVLADLGEIIQSGGTILLFAGLCMYGTILLHLLLARWSGIDRDTFLVTSTAALYGPAFIGPMCSVLNNRQLLVAGMAVGLLGYALGNFLGLGLAYVLRWALTFS
jgi:uncharacterized membrane protein